MVRGRRTRAAAHISAPRSIDDQYCASPKRKDCKLDNSLSINPEHLIVGDRQSDFNALAKNRSRSITNYFHVQHKDEGDEGRITVFVNNEEYVSVIDENACDAFPTQSIINNETYIPDTNHTNIFLQAPVLHLNIDKSLNQASSIVINKHIDFSSLTAAGLVAFSKMSTENSLLNGVKLSRPQVIHASETDSSISSDSNSCDSGVVVDKSLESPSRRRKPTTPHRIVCPSPVKHAIVEKSPSSALSNLNIGTKRNPKTKRRLIVNQTENFVVSTVTTKKSTQPQPQKKAILNSVTDPTAQQNTNNNKNTKLTDFFPVRRSVRKTKKAVELEQLRSIEAAIRNQQENGLMVKKFGSKGRGVVAARSFVKGEFVVEYIGDLIDMHEANEREQLYAKDENTGCYMYYFKHKTQQYCIDATAESGKLGRLVNHSRNGNLITKTVFYRNRPHLVLIAKEDIDDGEELTYDYGDRSKESLLHHPWLAL